MTAISKLQYGNRFGEEIARLAQEKWAATQTADMLSARYSRWFYGQDDASSDTIATAGQRYRTITSEMSALEIASATKNNLNALGEDANELFSARLPDGHRMRKAIRSTILPDMPLFGTCKFGEIVADRSCDTLSVTQVFVANFHGEIDTMRPGSIYRPTHQDFDQMFFGVHIVVDRFGSILGFDHDRGKNGVAFKTRSMREALFSIASVSTGLSREELQARARRQAA